MLARNEIARDYTDNRRLFKPLSIGLYPLSPALAVRQRGHDGADHGWVSVLRVLNLYRIKETADPRYKKHIDTLLRFAELALAGEALAHAHDARRKLHTLKPVAMKPTALRRSHKR